MNDKLEVGHSKSMPRQTGGAGFDFEDLAASWLMVKMLRGVILPGVKSSGVEIKWQTEALGWMQIDDLLVTCSGDGDKQKQLAISCKSNMQVSGSGLPVDFVNNAWVLWQKGAPFNKKQDCMMLIQKGGNQKFFTAWADLKLWCSESDLETVLARIMSSQKHRKIYDSVKTPEENCSYTDEDTIDLIRSLEVIPSDFHLASSEYEEASLAHCRDLLQSSSEETARTVWNWLLKKAKDKRISGGTLRLSALWQELVPVFDLKDHPNYASSWHSLEAISHEYKSTIEIGLPNGYSVERLVEDDLVKRLKDDQICVIYGSSGSGKSALVKSALDKNHPDWRQIWFSPENLNVALSERARLEVGLLKPLQEVLAHSSEEKNVLIIDSAERISPDCTNRVKSLISNLLIHNGEHENSLEWRVVIVGQTEAWGSGYLHEISGLSSIQPIEISALDPSDVRAALHSSNHLSWLASDNEALKALGNLKTLAWVMRAESFFLKGGMEEVSLPAIADRLWSYWTKDKIKFHNLLTQLAEREAQFERSFPISGLDIDVSEAIDEGIEYLPLRKRKDTNSIEFEHDLGADWARFQRLKEIKNNIDAWAPYASNPLWHNALRMMGQQLLREETARGILWDVLYEEAENAKDENPLAGDILLDSLCLDPFAEHYLSKRSELLFADKGVRLNRLLKRFHHIATVSNVSKDALDFDPALKLYFEDTQRLPIYGRWPQVAKFLTDHKEQVSSLISPIVSRICETWLTTTPQYLDREKSIPMPYRKEFAELALATARTLQLEQLKGHLWLSDNSEKPLYGAALAAVDDFPEEVCEWALEVARRKPWKKEIAKAVEAYNEEKSREHIERLRTDGGYRERIERLRSLPPSISSSRDLPPWPLGPQGRVDNNFRDYCLRSGALAKLMYLRPQVASELLLALIIDDSPTEDYSASPLRDDLGLEYSRSAYPTSYWKSPFYQFLHFNSAIALDALIALVNFCTDRWADDIENIYRFELTLQDDKIQSFMGDLRVFSWCQENSNFNGQLHCALAALEKWFCSKIDQEEDVELEINTLLESSNSIAIIGVLINVGKYKPDLYTSILQPLLGVYELYQVDDARIKNADYWFDAWAWVREGEKVFEMAKEWYFASYRKIPLRQLAAQLAIENEQTAKYIEKASMSWKASLGDKNEDLEKKILKAQLDPKNYKPVKDQQSGQTYLLCHYPDNLQQEINAFQQENTPRLQAITLSYECEKLLASSNRLNDSDAERLANALDDVVSIQEDEGSILATEAAISAALLVKASNWMNKNTDIKKHANDIIEKTIANIGDTLETIRYSDHFISNKSLAFAAHVVIEKWINSPDYNVEYDSNLLRILTSGDNEAVSIMMDAAYINRHKLCNRWWRLIQISILWSGLCSLGPGFREDEDKSLAKHWARWLRWLRARSLNVQINEESIDPIAIATRADRLKRARIRRLFGKDAEGRLRYYRRGFSGLETYALEKIFSWMLNDQNHGHDDSIDVRILTQKLWEYEVWRKQKCEEDSDNDKDSLPSGLGYSLLRKLSKLLVTSKKDEASNIWKPIFSLGVDGHHAIEHLIEGWLLEVVQSKNTSSLSLYWREMIEYVLPLSNWSPNKYWYKGEKLFRHILGLDSISFAEFEDVQNIVLKVKDLYEQWAKTHLSKEEDNVAAFARFLSSNAGAYIRCDGLLWIKDALLPPDALNWRREETGRALIELLDVIVSKEANKITTDASIREGLLSVAAQLAAKQVPVAFSLQERIRRES